MKRRIFAVLLAMAVMLTAAMFVSCSEAEEEEDLGEEMTIEATVRIVGNDGYVLIDNLKVTLTDYARNLTVLAATVRALDAADIEHGEEDGFIQSIGTYGVKDLRVSDYEDEEEDESEEEEGEENTTDFYWGYTVNGRESGGARSDLINDGDFIEWTFVETEW